EFAVPALYPDLSFLSFLANRALRILESIENLTSRAEPSHAASTTLLPNKIGHTRAIERSLTQDGIERLHKRTRSATVMTNPQPFPQSHPRKKVVVIIASDNKPDAIAEKELADIARGHFGSQIAEIKWLIMPAT